MSEMLMELKLSIGYAAPSGTWALYPDKIVITTLKPILGGFWAADDLHLEVPLKHVLEVEVQESGLLSEGFIRLLVDIDKPFGDVPVPKGQYKPRPHAREDPLGIAFRAIPHNKSVNKFKEEVHKLIGK